MFFQEGILMLSWKHFCIKVKTPIRYQMKILQTKWMSAVLLLIAFLLIYNPLTSFPYTFCVIITFVLLATYVQQQSLRSLNFRTLGWRELKIIAVSYPAIELTMDFVVEPLIDWACNEPADYSVFAGMQGNTSLYLKWLSGMWISAAVGEELLFRAFAFAQLRNVLGDRKILIVILSALLFCVPHLYQGVAGLLGTFVFGLAFGFLYLKYQNIWVNIIVHGLIDTLFLSLSYLGYLEFYELLW